MKLKVADYVAETAPLTLTINGAELQMQVRPGAYTTPFLESLDDRTIADALPELVAEWDLIDDVDGEEQVVPLTPEAVGALPLPLQSLIWRGVLAGMRPNSE